MLLQPEFHAQKMEKATSYIAPAPTSMATQRTPLVPKSPADASRRDFVMLMAGILSFAFISSLDATIVATLLSAIGSSLQSMQFSSWIGTAYILSRTASTPLLGRLANILGRRPSILFAATLFGVATVLCGFAQNIQVHASRVRNSTNVVARAQLVAYRALAGIGGSGLTVVGSIILSDSVPLKRRGLYQGFMNISWGLGAAVGAPLGGWLGDTIRWRAAFSCQAPILACGLLLVGLKVQEPPFILNAQRTTLLSKLKRIDYAGTFSLVAALLTFVVGMNFKTILGQEWDDPKVWGYLLASAVLLCTFLVVEFKLAAEPVMATWMLKLRTPFFVVTFSTLYNTPLYYTAARLRTSANAGSHLIPNSVCVAAGSLFAGWYMRHTGRYWKILVLGCLGLVVANCILASWSARTPEWVLYTTLMPSGFGAAGTMTITLSALIASVPPNEIPLATGLSYLFRTTGEVLGVSLSAALTQTLLVRELHIRIVSDGADEIIAKILASTEYILTLPSMLQEKAAASWMYALHTVFQCQMVVAICVSSLCYLLRSFRCRIRWTPRSRLRCTMDDLSDERPGHGR
ncbi:MFS general substrate transporter [Mycena albidolilacea]|uniref:MFS general substrate transporter n=1 Tax=Mycena albidolilacea TaxID=1033008 RepID=A0AAD7EGH5_9AGAR|nr:MFS general substrate transporter [Mycena albidolilacea]